MQYPNRRIVACDRLAGRLPHGKQVMWSWTIVALYVLTAFGAPALADRKVGRDAFYLAGCIVCHSIECNRVGPKLGGVVGRRAGSVSDYADYSDAMKRSNFVWTEETLDAFLANPAALLPGNGMASFARNLEDAGQRRDLIDFLREPDNSLDLCF